MFCSKRFVLFLAMASFLLSSLATPLNVVCAQEGSSEKSDDVFKDTFQDLSLIGYFGVGGAVLGLSTLSFSEKPKEHLKNIVVGGAIGIIIGVGVVAWRQATASRDAYDSAQIQRDATSPHLKNKWSGEFSTVQRIEWAKNEISSLSVFNPIAPLISNSDRIMKGKYLPLFYTFEF